MHTLDAPIPVLNFFLSHLGDARRRLWLARKVGALKSVTDSLVELKDRQGLDDFVQTVPTNTESRFYAETALRNLVRRPFFCKFYVRRSKILFSFSAEQMEFGQLEAAEKLIDFIRLELNLGPETT